MVLFTQIHCRCHGDQHDQNQCQAQVILPEGIREQVNSQKLFQGKTELHGPEKAGEAGIQVTLSTALIQ